MTKLEALKLLVLDVDGVLTDGTFYLGGHGDTEIKAFHARDGAGIALWRDAGYHVTFLTGGLPALDSPLPIVRPPLKGRTSNIRTPSRLGSF